MHVGQAVVAAAVAEGETLVVQSKLMQDGGVQVVERADVFHGVHAQFVGRAVGRAPLDAAPRQPNAKAFRVMVAAVAAVAVAAARLVDNNGLLGLGDRSQASSSGSETTRAMTE